MTIVELVLSAVTIVVAAALFTNAVELLGERLNLGQGAVGSVLAAVGTALPETMIPLVAVISIVFFGGGGVAGEIGIGAILGAPFLLATLAMFVVGISIQSFQRRRDSDDDVVVDREAAVRDLIYFLGLFTVGVAAGIVPLPLAVKVVLAVLLVGGYAFYVHVTIKSGGADLEETPDNLTLWPSSSPPPTWAVAAQVLGMVAVMGVGAHFFVHGVEHLSKSAGIPAGLIALVLAPLATELPEKFNSVIWLRGDKDTLALGNITGAMVFQGSVPVALGLTFMTWELGFLSALSAVLALAGGAYLLWLLRTKRPLESEYLLVGGGLYAVFVAAAIFSIV